VSGEFEALMLSFVFKAMRQTIPKSDFLGNARNQDWYTDLFDFELAKNFSQGKSVGLSAYLQQDLQRLQHRQASQRHPVVPGPGPAYRSDPVSPTEPRLQASASMPDPLSEAMILPVVGRLSSHYGERSDPLTGEVKFHHGIDITSPIGTEIRAALPGMVTFSGWQQGYGQTIILSHDNGYITQYAHNSANLAHVGEHVGRGQPIALVGQSGRATGPHVHFEVRNDGGALDPVLLLANKAAM
jgi:murein DD-endopeptidase MepM/ murein hydrolase activator NlpD